MINKLQELYLSSFTKKALGRAYYLVSVKPAADNITYASFFSMSVDSKEDFKKRTRHEERVIGLIDPEVAKDKFKKAGEKVAVIDNENELTVALNMGGHFLIEKDVMTLHWSEILVPRVTIDSYGQGCIDYNLIAKPQLARFAKGKLRMEVMSRDNLCCRVCGKSPDDERFLTLEVHHIKPWEEGGITEPSNLITLCNLCHGGINEVNRNLLWKKIGINFQFQNHLIYKNTPSLGIIIDNSVIFKIERRSTF